MIDRVASESMYHVMLKYHMVMTTEGDGHCLFRALSWCIFGHTEAYFHYHLTIELDSSDAIDIVALTTEKRSLKRRIQSFFSPSKDVSNSPLYKHQQSNQSETSASNVSSAH
jgi:hypothetical protein